MFYNILASGFLGEAIPFLQRAQIKGDVLSSEDFKQFWGEYTLVFLSPDDEWIDVCPDFIQDRAGELQRVRLTSQHPDNRCPCRRARDAMLSIDFRKTYVAVILKIKLGPHADLEGACARIIIAEAQKECGFDHAAWGHVL